MVESVWYELRNLVYAKQFENAAALLRANPQLVSLRNGIGETVLHYLAVENHSEGVAWLHASGFDIDCQNEFGTPVVFEVAQLGYKDLLLWFKAAGANFRTVDGEGNTILTYLRQFHTEEIDDIIKFVTRFAYPVINRT